MSRIHSHCLSMCVSECMERIHYTELNNIMGDERFQVSHHITISITFDVTLMILIIRFNLIFKKNFNLKDIMDSNMKHDNIRDKVASEMHFLTLG